MLEKFQRAICNNEPANLFESDKLGEGLQAGGFILPKITSELEIVRMEEMRNRFSYSDFLELWIATTYECNMACTYCGQHHVAGRAAMGDDVQDAIVGYLRRAFPTKKTANFCWYGGEPLMEPHVIHRLGNRITTYSCRVQRSTDP